MNRIPTAVYTKEFREEALKLAMTGGVGVTEAGRRLSISTKTLANRVHAARAGKLGSAGQHQRAPDALLNQRSLYFGAASPPRCSPSCESPGKFDVWQG